MYCTYQFTTWHFYIFSYPFTHIKLELAKCKTFPFVKGPSQYGEGHVSRLFIYNIDIVMILKVGHFYCFFLGVLCLHGCDDG